VTAFRLFVHVLSASVWVGGQIVLVGLVPTVRELGPDAPRRVARAFNRIAWPAYGIAVVTGLWNVFVLPLEDLQHPWIELKVLAVLLSGVERRCTSWPGATRRCWPSAVPCPACSRWPPCGWPSW